MSQRISFVTETVMSGAVGVMRYTNRRRHPLVPAEDLPDWVKKLLVD